GREVGTDTSQGVWLQVRGRACARQTRRYSTRGRALLAQRRPCCYSLSLRTATVARSGLQAREIAHLPRPGGGPLSRWSSSSSTLITITAPISGKSQISWLCAIFCE